MTCIADANVLFPLLVQGHAAHDAAMAWWDQQADSTVGTCLLTRLAVLRLLTNRTAMNGAPVRANQALDAWRQLNNDPRSLYIDSEPIGHDERFASLVSRRDATPNLWADAWLAALAIALNCEMTTFDHGFKSFSGLRLRLLTISHP
jgi:toxin-antitoxin system PIN domain toxin